MCVCQLQCGIEIVNGLFWERAVKTCINNLENLERTQKVVESVTSTSQCLVEASSSPVWLFKKHCECHCHLCRQRKFRWLIHHSGECRQTKRTGDGVIFNIYYIFSYKSWREPKTMLLARDANMRRVTKYRDIIAVLASSQLADKWMRFTNHLKYWQCRQQQDKGLKGCISMFRLSQLHIFWND